MYEAAKDQTKTKRYPIEVASCRAHFSQRIIMDDKRQIEARQRSLVAVVTRGGTSSPSTSSNTMVVGCFLPPGPPRIDSRQ